MNTLLYFIICAGLIFIGFKFNLFVGLAITAVLIAVVVHLNYPKYLLGRANAEFNQKNYDTAFELYEKAYKSNVRKFDVDLSYAQALLRTGKPDKALEIVNKLIPMTGLKKEYKLFAKQTRVMINYKLGDIEEAYEEATEMFEDGYTTSNMYCLVGLLMLAKGEPLEETTAFCEKAYDYDSDNRDNVDNLLVCCIKNGDFERANELANELTEEFPAFIEGWYHFAQVCYATGDNAKALECLEKAKEGDRSFLTTVSIGEIEALEALLR